jgi:hypothetical protein
MAPENEQYVQEMERVIDNIERKFLLVKDSMEASLEKLFKNGFSGLQDFVNFQSDPLNYVGEGMDVFLEQEFYKVISISKDNLILNQLVGIPLSSFSYLTESEMKAIGVEVVKNENEEKIEREDLYNALIHNNNRCLAYENVNEGEYCIHFILQADVDKEDKGFEYVERLQMYEINQVKEESK